LERNFSMPITLHAQQWWPLDQICVCAAALVSDYLTPILLIACFGFRFARKSVAASSTMPAICLASLFVAMLLSLWSAPRYLAPATASIFALVSIGISGVSRMNRGRFDGRVILIGALTVFAAGVTFLAGAYVIDTRRSTDWWGDKRTIREQLLQTEGDDLVFVRYSQKHIPHREWVYNGADIDRQPIVWAREINPESDAQLRAYFHSRKAWIVFADEKPARLVEWY